MIVAALATTIIQDPGLPTIRPAILLGTAVRLSASAVRERSSGVGQYVGDVTFAIGCQK
jgi:hypothetical protein